jgi:hypothetical protein
MSDQNKVTIKGSLHSFVWEIGRFTKTSGFHYSILHNKIVHHNGKWEVSYNPLFNYILVKGEDGQQMKIYRNHFFINGQSADIVETPGGAVYTAAEIWAFVMEAVAKYAVAQFFGVEYADHLHPLLQSTG